MLTSPYHPKWRLDPRCTAAFASVTSPDKDRLSLGVLCPHISETQLVSSGKNHNTEKMSDIWGDALYPLTSLNDAVCVFALKGGLPLK